MTYNVHRCVGVDGRLDVSRVAQVIAAAKPDVVALQELDVGRARTGGVDQAHAIAAEVGMHVHFHAALKVAEEQYGDAILTTAPLTFRKAGALPTSPSVRGLEPRGALWVSAEIEGAQVQIVNTHLGLVPHEQRAQAEALVTSDWMGHPDCTDPALLVGDFNATSQHAAYRTLAGRLADAQLEVRKRGRTLRTFPSRMPMLRIDHVFASRSVKVKACHVPDSPLARVASDHLPLVVDFKVDRSRWV
ncbi:MAG TPA: endonuclease/exonuclease/phosphatase family protein [Caulobacteraceae bacterium]